MRDRIRQWVSPLLARLPRGSRAAIVAGLLTALATLVLREIGWNLIVNITTAALTDGPVWRRLLVGGLLLAGVVAAVVAWSPRPRPDPVADGTTLPPAPPTMVGRQTDLATVVGLLETARVVAVVGRRAFGTSALAVHVAHRVADRFPDGSIYLDLRGLQGEPRLSGGRALQRVLQLLDLPEPRSQRADDLDEATERLRAWLVDRKILLLMNNVDQPQQVRRLLNVGPGCRVLLAGSVDLTAIPGVRVHQLSELRESAAVEVLAEFSSHSLVEQEPAAAANLVNQLGRQPLAIRLLGQLVRDRGWTLHRVVAVLKEAQRQSPYRRGASATGPLQLVWAACDLTYQEMSPDRRRLFRLLTLIPTIDVGTHAAGALAGISSARAAAMLEELVRRGLVESAEPGRYRVRQLLATSAARRLRDDEPQRRLIQARMRLARHYALLTERYAEPLLLGRGRSGHEQRYPDAIDDSLRWFEREHDVLFRLVTTDRSGLGRRPAEAGAWPLRLAIGLCTWYAYEGRLDDWQKICQAVLLMPIARRRPEAAFWAHNELGVIYREQAQLHRAWRELELAKDHLRGRRKRGLAQVQTNRGLVLIDLGQFDSAAQLLELAVRLRSRADRRGRAVSALGLGAAYAGAGDLVAARRQLTRAANDFDLLHDGSGFAASLNALGVVLWEQGEGSGAEEHWNLSREHYVDLGDDVGVACVMLNRAAVLIRTNPELAGQAVTMLTESLDLRAGHPQTAGLGLTHLCLGDAQDLLGEPERAREHWMESLRILEPLHVPAVVQARRRLIDDADL